MINVDVRNVGDLDEKVMVGIENDVGKLWMRLEDAEELLEQLSRKVQDARCDREWAEMLERSDKVKV